MKNQYKVLTLFKFFHIELFEVIFASAIILAFLSIFLLRFFNKKVSEKNKKIKRIINFFLYSEKLYRKF